jgi:hypothetical protein
MSERAFTILDAIRNEHLFAPAFKNLATWKAWLAFLCALFGLKLDDDELAIFRQCTGRDAPSGKPYASAFLICGRRSGKSFMMALIGVFLACFRDYKPYLGPGEKATVMMVAADRKQARVVLRFVRGLLSVPVLARRIVADRSEELELEGDVILQISTASHSVRGYSVAAALVDEIAFLAADDANVSGQAVIEAIKPAMLNIPSSMLICASSPYSRSGPLWDAYRRFYGVDDASTLIWRAATLVMNPSVPERIISEAYEADAASAAAEYGAEFRTDIQAFILHEQLDPCIDVGVKERPPMADVSAEAFLDPAGGSGADAMAICVGHKEGDVVVIDAIRSRRPPFDPSDVVNEFCDLLASYKVTKVTSDRWGGEFVRQPFRDRGVGFELAEKSKSDLYRDLVPLINSRRISILDDRQLINEILGLERRTARGTGRDTIDHGPNAGAHDDRANCCAGVAFVLQAESWYWRNNAAWISGPSDPAVHPPLKINPDPPPLHLHPSLQGIAPWLIR